MTPPLFRAFDHAVNHYGGPTFLIGFAIFVMWCGVRAWRGRAGG